MKRFGYAGVLGGWIEFHENGLLKSALIDADWQRDQIVHRRGTRVEFDAEGRPLPPPPMLPPDIA